MSSDPSNPHKPTNHLDPRNSRRSIREGNWVNFQIASDDRSGNDICELRLFAGNPALAISPDRVWSLVAIFQ
jgi:hypothetical protein